MPPYRCSSSSREDRSSIHKPSKGRTARARSPDTQSQRRWRSTASVPAHIHDLRGFSWAYSVLAATPMSSLSGIAILDSAVTPHVRVRRWQHRSGPTAFPAASHSDVELAWVQSGEASYRIGSREVSVPAGSAIVVPARVEHATRVAPGTRASSVWLSSALVLEVAATVSRSLPNDVVVLQDTRPFASLGDLLYQEAANTAPGQLLAVDALARALAVTLVRAAARDAACSTTDPRIAAALALIEERYADSLGVDELARAAGSSRFHFSRMFREVTGKSPYQYLQRTRVLRAAELLESGGHGVTEVAFSVGYRDLGRFSRAFREEFGFPPSELVRKRARNARRSARSA